MRAWTSPERVRVKNAERHPLQVRVDGGAQVVHHTLADLV